MHTAAKRHIDFFTEPIHVELSDDPLISDAGLLLIHPFDKSVGLIAQFATELNGRRNPDLIDHSFI